MTDAPREIEALIEMMARLPGLGPRSARRAVLHLINKRAVLMAPLAAALADVARTVRECVNCGNIGTAELCPICMSEKRATGEICVVEDVADLWAMERGGSFRGRYHVLGGTLSALDAIGPEELRIPRLVERIATEKVTEVILALNATVDGQTTAHYIAEALEGTGVSDHQPGPGRADRRRARLSRRRHDQRRAARAQAVLRAAPAGRAVSAAGRCGLPRQSESERTGARGAVSRPLRTLPPARLALGGRLPVGWRCNG